MHFSLENISTELQRIVSRKKIIRVFLRSLLPGILFLYIFHTRVLLPLLRILTENLVMSRFSKLASTRSEVRNQLVKIGYLASIMNEPYSLISSIRISFFIRKRLAFNRTIFAEIYTARLLL